MFRGLSSILVFCLISANAVADAAALRVAANAFLASLTPDQRELVQYRLKEDARATWSNLPTLMAPPAGILIADLDDRQRQHLHEVLRASLSSQGYGKALGIMWLDDLLHETEGQRLAADPSARTPRAEAMVANRVRGVRCALCWDEHTARLAREHNDANALSLGQRLISLEKALAIVEIWLETPFEGGRHVRRIELIDQIES